VTSRLRRTLLYIPGNNPAMLNNAGIFGADVIVLDLEDAVAPNEKDAARRLVAGALEQLAFLNPAGAEIMVRINGIDTPFARDDLEAIVPVAPNSIRLPKAQSKETVLEIAALLEKLEKAASIDCPIEISPILETALGVSNAREIATAHPRVTALSFGAEDFTRDLGTSRSKAGTELAHARGAMVLAAKAADIQALDTVFADINDEEGLRAETAAIKQFGFDGKSVIHPRQIAPIHEIFNPTAEEIEMAQAIEAALAEAEKKGSGVASLNGRMIDAPVVKKARRILAFARRLELIKGGGVNAS